MASSSLTGVVRKLENRPKDVLVQLNILQSEKLQNLSMSYLRSEDKRKMFEDSWLHGRHVIAKCQDVDGVLKVHQVFTILEGAVCKMTNNPKDVEVLIEVQNDDGGHETRRAYLPYLRSEKWRVLLEESWDRRKQVRVTVDEDEKMTDVSLVERH